MRLRDRVAIVTGGGRGIGRAVALGYAREGAHVVVASRTMAQVEEVADEIRSEGRKSLAVQTDVTDEVQVEHLVELTLKEFGTIDVLVNNAGAIRPDRIVAMKTGDWEHVIRVNLTGTFFCCRAVLPTMLANKRGWIINISSDSGKRGWPEGGAYCASKFGIIGLTESLAFEVMHMGIVVNALCPGAVVTEMSRQGRTEEELTGWMQPEDMVGPAVFLASDEARNLLGASVDVFGKVR
ncbi:MAG: SDR family NAD(P)-dependent oxidoreductase [Spirochaetota bacterium]